MSVGYPCQARRIQHDPGSLAVSGFCGDGGYGLMTGAIRPLK